MSIYTLGIDIGSTASKCVILADGKEIVAKSLIAVGAGTRGPQRAISQVLENAGMKESDMAFTLATGYGRNSLDGIADYQMSELSCHAKGASFLFPDVHTVVDIGGQDVKVLQIENGVMTNFVMNDKCAAGTGRFLDVMARVLEVKVEELGTLGAQSTKDLAISSTCTVFAESEDVYKRQPLYRPAGGRRHLHSGGPRPDSGEHRLLPGECQGHPGRPHRRRNDLLRRGGRPLYPVSYTHLTAGGSPIYASLSISILRVPTVTLTV